MVIVTAGLDELEEDNGMKKEGVFFVLIESSKYPSVSRLQVIIVKLSFVMQEWLGGNLAGYVGYIWTE